MIARSAAETIKFFGTGAVLASFRPVAGCAGPLYPSPVWFLLPVGCTTTATPFGELTLLVTPIPSAMTAGIPTPAPAPDREGVCPSGLAASTVGEALPLPAPVNVAALLLVLMKLGINDDRGEVGEVAPDAALALGLGVGRGVPLGDRPLNGEFGIGICVGRLVARDMIGRGWVYGVA
jgi:hypothetical protein